MKSKHEYASSERLVITTLVCLLFFMDQILVTVIVPVLPAFLNHEMNEQRSVEPINNMVIGDDHLNLNNKNNYSTIKEPSLSVNVTTDSHQHHPDNDVRLSFLFASRGVMMLISGLLIGSLVDRSCPLVALAMGTATDMVAVLIYGFGQSYVVLFVARALHGSASAMVGTGGLAIIAETFTTSRERSRMVGVINLFLFFGESLGPAYGGAVHQYAGKVLTFMLLIPVFGVCALLAIPVYRITQRKSGIDMTDEILEITSKDESIVVPTEEALCNTKMEIFERDTRKATPVYRLIFDPFVAVASFVLLVSNLSRTTLAATLSVWMELKFRAEEWQQGVVWFPSMAFNLLGTAFAIILCKYFPRQRYLIAMFGLVVSGLACFSLPYCSNWIIVSLPVGLVFFSIMVCDVSVLPLLNNIVDKRHKPVYGSVSGIAYAAYSAASALSVILSGPFKKAFGFAWMNNAIFIMCVAYSPLLILTRRYCDK